jgi:hypothetical protein
MLKKIFRAIWWLLKAELMLWIILLTLAGIIALILDAL